MKDVKIAGEEGREFWFKLGEPVKEAAHDLAERAFGAVEGGGSSGAATCTSAPLPVGRIRQQHWHQARVGQPLGQFPVLVVAGMVVHDVERGRAGRAAPNCS